MGEVGKNQGVHLEHSSDRIHIPVKAKRGDTGRKYKPKRIVRHQTNTKIDALVAAHRSHPWNAPTPQTREHLALLCDISRNRTGRTPGLTEAEANAEVRDQDIWECYAEETRWPGTVKEFRQSLEAESGVFVFRGWGNSDQHELVFEPPRRKVSRTAQISPQRVPVRPPLAQISAPIPIESSKTRVQPKALSVPNRPAESGPPVATHKCRRYVPGDDGECMCPRCYKQALLMAEWYKRHRVRQLRLD